MKIFNEKEVDELVLLDIQATRLNRDPDIALVKEIVSEAFMPVAFGGGIRTQHQAERLVSTGIEKVVLNTAAVTNPALVSEIAKVLGSQSVVVSLDVKRSFFGKYEVMTHGGRRASGFDPPMVAKEMEARGAGEILLNSVDRDGTMRGYDTKLIHDVCDAVKIPVIACGGAGSLEHMREAVKLGGASAVAAGSIFVFQGRHRAVLINYPPRALLEQVFEPLRKELP